jgi:hypothetical protein
MANWSPDSATETLAGGSLAPTRAVADFFEEASRLRFRVSQDRANYESRPPPGPSR